jgi:hypothetical protein
MEPQLLMMMQDGTMSFYPASYDDAGLYCSARALLKWIVIDRKVEDLFKEIFRKSFSS